MSALKNYLCSSIGRKQMMGVTGIWMYFFLFIHLLGNLGIFVGAERYNKYGYLVIVDLWEIIIPVELSLIFAFLLHIFLGYTLRAENRSARPVAYKAKASEGGKTLYSTSMMVTGIVMAVFVLLHVMHFRFGFGTERYEVYYDGVKMHDHYRVMMEGFAIWWYTATYVIVMVLIASHLAHGVQSSLQSLGFNHPKYTPFVGWFSRGYAVFISGGFSFLAIWSYFQRGGGY